jgi:hypothetical protein
LRSRRDLDDPGAVVRQSPAARVLEKKAQPSDDGLTCLPVISEIRDGSKVQGAASPSFTIAGCWESSKKGAHGMLWTQHNAKLLGLEVTAVPCEVTDLVKLPFPAASLDCAVLSAPKDNHILGLTHESSKDDVIRSWSPVLTGLKPLISPCGYVVVYGSEGDVEPFGELAGLCMFDEVDFCADGLKERGRHEREGTKEKEAPRYKTLNGRYCLILSPGSSEVEAVAAPEAGEVLASNEQRILSRQRSEALLKSVEDAGDASAKTLHHRRLVLCASVVCRYVLVLGKMMLVIANLCLFLSVLPFISSSHICTATLFRRLRSVWL